MNKETNYWKTAEQMNGRLAMMGFFAAVINYGLTGWIIPGIVQTYLSNQIKKASSLSLRKGPFLVLQKIWMKILNLIN